MYSSVKVSDQTHRYALMLCVALLAAGVFARALENRLSQYRDDPGPEQFISKGARLAECRLDKLDIPAIVETSAIMAPLWFEAHAAAELELPTVTLDFVEAIPHLRGPPQPFL
jgi:hypothetical protein